MAKSKSKSSRRAPAPTPRAPRARRERLPRKAVAAPLPAHSAGRAVLLATLALTPLALWTPTYDIYTIPKFVVLVLGAVGILVCLAWSLTSARSERVTSTVLRLALAFVAVMALATALGDRPALSLMGEYGRNAGLLTYACGALLLYATINWFNPDRIAQVAWVVAGAGAVVIAYGVLQALGAEPLSVPDIGAVASTLGQPNYVGGYLGVLTPILLWVAASPRNHLWLRVAGVAALVGAVAIAPQTHSFQALPTMVAGALAFGFIAYSAQIPARRLLVGAVTVVVLGGAVAAALHGPIERQVRSGLDERVLMWQAAGRMVEDRPVLGWGPSGYAAEFTTYRPAAHARRFGFDQLVDVPHDVPLSFFVSGGVVLGALYLAFVGATGLLLVRGVRTLTGERRFLLAALGGAWFAYQVQSVVSIDMPAFVALHFVLAGAVVVLVGTERRTPRSAPEMFVDRRGGATTTAVAVRATAGVAALVVAVFALRAFAGDLNMAEGVDARASDSPEASLPAFASATGLAGWNARYWAARAGALAASGDQDGALAVGQKAADLAPSSASYALTVAQSAERMGRIDLADRYFASAVEHSPHVAAVLTARAAYLFDQGRFAAAMRQAQQSLDETPEAVEVLLLYARAAEGAGRHTEAERAYRKVLDVQPGNPDALVALGLPLPG